MSKIKIIQKQITIVIKLEKDKIKNTKKKE